MQEGTNVLPLWPGPGHALASATSESQGAAPLSGQAGLSKAQSWRWWWRYAVHVDQLEAEASDPLHEPGKGSLIG